MKMSIIRKPLWSPAAIHKVMPVGMCSSFSGMHESQPRRSVLGGLPHGCTIKREEYLSLVSPHIRRGTLWRRP